MAYKQVRRFYKSKGGSRPGWCLANTTAGFQIPNKYPSAWEAWKHTEKHAGVPPKGLDVPVYFSYYATIDGIYKNWGHIGVRLKDGQFWSDGVTYPSIASYTNNHAPKYVGWGESVNDYKVIEKEEALVIEEQPPVFDAKYYLEVNKDVAKHSNTKAYAKVHWKKHGIKEGRPSAPNLHVREYVNNYSDLRRVFGTNKDYKGAVKHYYNNGINEGRSGRKRNPVVNTAQATLDKIKALLGGK